jgi:hypothetical protein
MINGNRISVLITSYKSRFSTLDQVIQSWTAQPVDEIWVIDDGNNFSTKIKDSRLLIFNMPKDFETKSDYALASLTEGDYIIFADDDVIVRNNFSVDLYIAANKTNGGIVGVIGYNGRRLKRSWSVKELTRVFWVGIVIMIPRKYICFDVRGMHKNCDDLWLCMKIHRNINKYVVPTKNYINLSISRNSTALTNQKELKKARQDFFDKYK